MSAGNVVQFPVRLTDEQRWNVERHVHIVEVLAKDLFPQVSQWLTLDEARSLGRDGLVRAAQLYKPDAFQEKATFVSFAWPHVHGAILMGARREARAARIDDALRRGLMDFSDMDVEGGDYRDSDDRVKAQYEAAAADAALSMFAAICGQGSTSPEEQYVERETQAQVDAAVENLPDLHRTLIHERYRNGREMDAIASDLGKSSATARRLKAEAVERLRKLLASEGLFEKKKAGGTR